ncbi:hypothetical protein PILCRDRAFT_107096 [Piloderma croceum F 1598]|uniref:RRM domain-containing protein n=1 Tax=Piloderma croceum (strain F 1598) TaxID=765440 RepID=A0A0C3GN68_PILCF|nr:hypothetical protein PILCRDRAFT_107096 [Piloderma croceum F 1598]
MKSSTRVVLKCAQGPGSFPNPSFSTSTNLKFFFVLRYRHHLVSCFFLYIQQIDMSAKVYVGNLSWNTTDDTLREVSVVLLSTRMLRLRIVSRTSVSPICTINCRRSHRTEMSWMYAFVSLALCAVVV